MRLLAAQWPSSTRWGTVSVKRPMSGSYVLHSSPRDFHSENNTFTRSITGVNIKITGLEAGLILNFRHPRLDWKKIVLQEGKRAE